MPVLIPDDLLQAVRMTATVPVAAQMTLEDEPRAAVEEATHADVTGTPAIGIHGQLVAGA